LLCVAAVELFAGCLQFFELVMKDTGSFWIPYLFQRHVSYQLQILDSHANLEKLLTHSEASLFALTN